MSYAAFGAVFLACLLIVIFTGLTHTSTRSSANLNDEPGSTGVDVAERTPGPDRL
jgi:hypothetical protein